MSYFKFQLLPFGLGIVKRAYSTLVLPLPHSHSTGTYSCNCFLIHGACRILRRKILKDNVENAIDSYPLLFLWLKPHVK